MYVQGGSVVVVVVLVWLVGSRLKKLESVLPRVYEVEEKLREGQVRRVV